MLPHKSKQMIKTIKINFLVQMTIDDVNNLKKSLGGLMSYEINA